MSEREVIIGNLTTIIMFIFSACGGGAIIETLGGTSQVAIIVGAILGLAFSIINAYFPNFFGFLNNNRKNIQDIADAVSKCDNCDCIEETDDDNGCENEYVEDENEEE